MKQKKIHGVSVMQRWNRKKTHFPLLALFFLLFIVLTILHNERRILKIQQDHPDHVHHHREAPITYVKPNLLSFGNRAPGMTSSSLGLSALLYCAFFQLSDRVLQLCAFGFVAFVLDLQ